MSQKTYFIKRPGDSGKRATYAVVERIDKKNSILRHPAIDTLNTEFLAGRITTAYVESELRDLIHRLRGKDKDLHEASNPENLKILDRFLETKYENRTLQDPRTNYNDYRRAVEALGDVSLLTASSKELQRAINKRLKAKPNKQRRVISRLKVILKFLNRHDVELELLKKPKIEVRHLSAAEMLKVTEKIEIPHLRLYYQTAFYTGCRKNELWALESEVLNEAAGSLKVHWQIDDDGVKRPPKRERQRRTFVPQDGMAYVKAWCALSYDEKMAIRGLHVSERLKNACRATFPTREDKHCTTHDLRHSYAIFLLANGFTLEWVAKLLGDSIKVTEDYYSGYVTTDVEVEAMQMTYNKRRVG